MKSSFRRLSYKGDFYFNQTQCYCEWFYYLNRHLLSVLNRPKKPNRLVLLKINDSNFV